MQRVIKLKGEHGLVEITSSELGESIKTKPFVVVGIPAYNEEKTIAKVIICAQKHASMVVVCDDGSSDSTMEIAQRLGADVISHEHNAGYGAAIQSLFNRARTLNADILVTLDGDGQHNPDEIPQLLEPIVNDTADVVIGSRFIDNRGSREMPFYRQVGVRIITLLANGVGKNGARDTQSGFRAYGNQALSLLEFSEDGMSASVEILRASGKQGLKLCEVPISCKYENGNGVKTSTHNPLSHGISLVMSLIKLVVEDRPLMLLGIPGILFLVAGSFFGVWMLQIYAIEHQIITNLALASVAFVLIGFFALSTSITLYAISRSAEKIRGQSKKQ